MPCALAEPENYPDYLKSYLKEIAAGNDQELKTCACQLKSPLSQDGCPIVDEDGKVGAFPFCVNSVPVPDISAPGFCGGPNWFGCSYEPGSGLTLKQAMKMYWLTSGIKIGTINPNDLKNIYEIEDLFGSDERSPICDNVWLDIRVDHYEEQSATSFNLNGLRYDGTYFYFGFDNHWYSNNPNRIKYQNGIFYFSAAFNPPDGSGSQNVITVEPIYGNSIKKTKLPELGEASFRGGTFYSYNFKN